MKLVYLILFSLFLLSCERKQVKDFSGWSAYAGSKDGIRYSSNTQINKENVQQLKVAWRFNTHDKDSANRTQNQCNPIVVDGVLYGTSPTLKLFALDAASGEQKWIFDPASLDTAKAKDPFAFYKVNRGVMYWESKSKDDKRIFYSAGAQTFAIDAKTGRPITSFGKGGFIDLSENLERDKGSFNPFVASTTPGVIYQDLLIIGTRVAESADAAPGHIRAYDVHDGSMRWIFHTIPHPGEVGYETWPDKNAWQKLGGANSWAGMALDEERGIVYVPTGSVSGDFYGGFRKGQNLFGNSLIALDAATGKYKWHFQVVHHDLWDRDLAANPNLITLTRDGKSVDAVAQITKHGYVFVFDRVTGESLFPIEEIAVPQDALPGEEPWPTQPIPKLPEPFARQFFDSTLVSDITPETHQYLLQEFQRVEHFGLFYPPSKNGSWIFPGFDGGGEWGGAAVDPETGILYVNSSELPWSLTMIDIPNSTQTTTIKGSGQEIYSKYCLSCHGADRKGNGASFPSLTDLDKKYSESQITRIVKNGKNMMPAFNQLTGAEHNALLAYLLDTADEPLSKEPVSPESDVPRKKSILDEVPYTMTGYNRFLDKDGYPGIKPPWGTLNAVDLNSGELLWKVPLGEFEELTARGIPPTGTENYGGPVVTAGGLVFIAATKDEKIRAFDKDTGKVLWEAKLPAAGYATPAVYDINGKQYVVIACGGGKIGSKSGDEYVAFSL